MDDESNAGVEEEEMGADLQDDEGVEDEESLSSEDSEGDTDWKAIAEKAQTEAENYKKALTQKRQLRTKKPEPEVEEETEGEDDDEDKPLTRSEFLRMQSETKVDSMLESQVKDPEKRKLVKLYYDTRIRQTGTSDDAIRSDISAALAIADAHKLRKTNEELARSAQRDTTPPLGGSQSDRGGDQKTHKFSDGQIKVLTETAKRLNADPAKFIADAWKNQKGR